MRTPLREHPLMRRGVVPNWPPVWTQWTKGGGINIVKGEVGVLRYVRSPDHPSKKCFLVIEYDGQHYVGTLLFDDSSFCSQVCKRLQHQLGRAISEVGDLDVSFTL
jgi:hypothetical protein